ncbi:hypothetical protein O6H91_Y282200 [Diphasiastrum complanatum]|nr:hypothetical protein O6H91_Y282200 [Diphasiastrum complanatum]
MGPDSLSHWLDPSLSLLYIYLPMRRNMIWHLGKMRDIAVAAIFCWTLLSCSYAAQKTLLLDTDVDNEDMPALLYILKQPRSQIHLKVLFILWFVLQSICSLVFKQGSGDRPEHEW